MGDAPGDMGDINNGGEHVILNENPHFLMSSYYAVTSFLGAYGWFILFGVVFLIILWSNVERKVKKFVEKSSANGQELSPDVLAKRAEAMELARQRQQEKASAIIQREAERRRELEEQKRVEKISDFDAMKSGKSLSSTQRKLHQNEAPTSSNNSSKPRNQARPLRDNDFNPLMGSSSARYRPAPRRTGGG